MAMAARAYLVHWLEKNAVSSVQRLWISLKSDCESAFHVPTAYCVGEFGTSRLLGKGGLCYLYANPNQFDLREEIGGEAADRQISS